MKPKFILTYLFICCVALPGAAQTYFQYVDSADYYIKKENWLKAEQMTIAALKSMPANRLNVHLWSNLGDIRTRRGDFDGAIQAFDIGLAKDPNNTTILCNRAFTLLSVNNESDALADINHALEVDSTLAWPRRMRATLSLAKNNFPQAEKDFISLRNHHPELAAPYAGLGKIAALKGETNNAIPLFEKALEIEHDQESWFYLILLNIESDQLPKAKELLNSAMKRYPNDGNFYLLRGIIRKKSFENDGALADRKRAIEYGADPELIKKFFPVEKK